MINSEHAAAKSRPKYVITHIFKPEQKSTWTLFVVKFDKFKPMAVTHHQAAESSHLFCRACSYVRDWKCPNVTCNDGWVYLTVVFFFSYLFSLTTFLQNAVCHLAITVTFCNVYKGFPRLVTGKWMDKMRPFVFIFKRAKLKTVSCF